MAGPMRKYKRMMVNPAGRPNSEINVTPLVDVVLVLLIIFMVVTPLMEKDLEVRVPSTEQVEEVSEVPPDQLVVNVDAQGNLKINNQAVTEQEYSDRLKQILQTHKAGDKLVFFIADDKANYGKLVAALDGATQAGAETLGMMTDVPEGVVVPPTDGTGNVPPPPPPAPGP